jgi:hypothetical protein
MKLNLVVLIYFWFIALVIGPVISAAGATESGLFGVTQSSGGDVTVDLTPLKSSDGELQVKITITTHNVNNLHQYNLKEIVTLDDGARVVSPTSAPKLGGHHTTGKLVFPMDRLPNRFIIRIKGLHDQGIREFVWSL